MRARWDQIKGVHWGSTGRTEEGVVLEDGLQEGIVLQECGVPVEAAQRSRFRVLSGGCHSKSAQSCRPLRTCPDLVQAATYGCSDPVDEADTLEKICVRSLRVHLAVVNSSPRLEWLTEGRAQERQVDAVLVPVVLKGLLCARKVLLLEEGRRGLLLLVAVCAIVVPRLVAVRLGAARARVRCCFCLRCHLVRLRVLSLSGGSIAVIALFRVLLGVFGEAVQLCGRAQPGSRAAAAAAAAREAASFLRPHRHRSASPCTDVP